jgi:hypothetical protein
MVIANLIGFGMGHEGLIAIIYKILGEFSLFRISIILLWLWPTSTFMFYLRELEEKSSKVKY